MKKQDDKKCQIENKSLAVRMDMNEYMFEGFSTEGFSTERTNIETK